MVRGIDTVQGMLTLYAAPFVRIYEGFPEPAKPTLSKPQ